MRSFFPDVNVWIALAYRGHQHHSAAASWFEKLDGQAIYFCRITQLSFLRLITHPAVMGEDLMSQSAAWAAYDALLADDRIFFHPEPDTERLDGTLRALTTRQHSSSGQWPDAYLSAFAQTAGLILVTFDRALHQTTKSNSLLLR